jgi:hypothetical protein
MAFETFCRYNKFAKRLYAQFNLIRSFLIWLRDSYGDQQATAALIFNFVGWRKIAAAMSHESDYTERSPIERMALILNLDHVGRRFVRLTRGDIPEGLRACRPSAPPRSTRRPPSPTAR